MRSIPTDLSLVAATRFFRDFIQRLVAQGKPIVLIVDELERILPSGTKVTSWNNDYIDLWRLLRSEAQARSGKFTFLVAATNPYFVESAKFNDEDNPLYRFIRPIYLPMFSPADLSEMLHKLGKPMGVTFRTNALEEIYRHFGGHPLLSRQLCSAIAKDLHERPLEVDARHVRQTLQRKGELFNNDMDAILKVFSDYYPDEFSLLQSLAKDEKRGVRLLDQNPIETHHLTGYGLLDRTKYSYRFTMAALPSYLSLDRSGSEIRPAQLPAAATERHIKLQGALNKIEPALRNLVFYQFKASFGELWQEKLFNYLQDGTKAKIESSGKLTSQELLEETLLSEILAAISGNWSLFSKVFGDRNEFRRHTRVLNDVARSASDHRKFTICENDGKYFPAIEACVYFEEKLLN